MANGTERIALSGSKGLIGLALALFLGGGAGVGVYRAATGSEAQAAPIVQTDVEQLAAKAAVQAMEVPLREAAQRQAQSQASLAQSQASLAASLNRLENKVDRLADDISVLKVEFTALRALRAGR
jgi:hypothetical protein